MTVAVLPTRRDEAFRYSDIEALASVWPVASERIVVAAGGHLSRTIINIAEPDDVIVRNLEVILEPGAKADIRVLNVGGRLGRISLDVTCQKGSDFHLGAVQIGAKTATLETVTTITHAEPGATSRQVVRSVVGGNATATYLGKVAVARAAQQTDSEQDVKAMLLDRTATANAKPELEIFADDVKCAHGCAIGELDAQALFYLQSRGLAPTQARTLLLQAFVAGVFDGSDDAQRLQELALAKLGELV